jgi:hypothetical protein
MEVGGHLHDPAALLAGKNPVNHYIRGWMGPRDGLTFARRENVLPLPGGGDWTVQTVAWSLHYLSSSGRNKLSNSLNPWRKPVLKATLRLNPSRNSLHFVEPEGSFPYSQQPAICSLS